MRVICVCLPAGRQVCAHLWLKAIMSMLEIR